MALRNGDDTLNESLDILESLSRMAVAESAALAAECRITGQTAAQRGCCRRRHATAPGEGLVSCMRPNSACPACSVMVVSTTFDGLMPMRVQLDCRWVCASCRMQKSGRPQCSGGAQAKRPRSAPARRPPPGLLLLMLSPAAEPPAAEAPESAEASGTADGHGGAESST